MGSKFLKDSEQVDDILWKNRIDPQDYYKESFLVAISKLPDAELKILAENLVKPMFFIE